MIAIKKTSPGNRMYAVLFVHRSAPANEQSSECVFVARAIYTIVLLTFSGKFLKVLVIFANY